MNSSPPAEVTRPLFTDAGQLASYLRIRDAVIVCHPDTITVDEPGSEEAGADLSEEALWNGQLLLPIPAVRPQRMQPDQRVSGPRPEDTKPP